MNVDDMIILSIDDHVDRAPRPLRAPRARELPGPGAPSWCATSTGIDQWVFEGQDDGHRSGLNAMVSWPKERVGHWTPASLAEMRPGAYHIHERVRDMDRNGVLASMCFPSMAGFSGRRFQEAKDTDLALVMLKAYNDWHIDEWCARIPGRFIPLAIGPTWDMDAMVDEVRRMAAKGCRADQHARASPRPGLADVPRATTGTRSSPPCATRTSWCACTSGIGLDAINMGPDFSPTTTWSSRPR